MTGIQLEEVHAALVASFDSQSFAFFLKTRMEKVLANIAGAGPFNNVVFEVLTVAEQEGWDALLIARAAEVRPFRGDLQALAQMYGRTLVGQVRGPCPQPIDPQRLSRSASPGERFPAENKQGGLEKLIDPQNGFVDMPAWLNTRSCARAHLPRRDR